MTKFSQYPKLAFFCAIVFSLLSLLFTSCHHPDEPQIKLKVNIEVTALDTGVTDAYVRVQIKGFNAPYTLSLKRDGNTILTVPQSVADTIFLDTALLLNHTYSYKAYAYNNGRAIDSSNLLSLTTLDTTNHDFTWEVVTLGDGNSSLLRDVSIINDTCIWAVGDVSLKDSTGQFEIYPYGAARWNGTHWNLLKVPYHDYHTTNTDPGPLRTVFAFSITSIYVTSSANLLKSKGNTWEEKAFFMKDLNFNGRVNKIWGSKENDFYLVGENGAMYYYLISSWQKIESGTDISINDIWGMRDQQHGTDYILAACSNVFTNENKGILLIKSNNTVDSIRTMDNWKAHSLWFNSSYRLFVCGEGVRQWRYQKGWQEMLGHNDLPYFTERIRGTALNDIFVVGDYGQVWHFNGMTWKRFFAAQTGSYYSCDYRGNMLCAVGMKNARAVALRMWR